MTEAPDPERRPIAVLAAALPRQDQRLDLERPLGELAALADTAGVEVRGESIIQRRDRPYGATSLGKGTVLRLQEALEATGAELVIFDNDLKTANNGIRDVSGELGIVGMPPVAEAAWGSPQVGMSGVGVVAGWGESTEGPFINRSRTYQIFNNLSWVRGNHSFKFGGEIANRRYNVIGNQFPRGLLQFHSRATALPTNLNGSGDCTESCTLASTFCTTGICGSRHS